jgi:hypothetical protein
VNICSGRNRGDQISLLKNLPADGILIPLSSLEKEVFLGEIALERRLIIEKVIPAKSGDDVDYAEIF